VSELSTLQLESVQTKATGYGVKTTVPSLQKLRLRGTNPQLQELSECVEIEMRIGYHNKPSGRRDSSSAYGGLRMAGTGGRDCFWIPTFVGMVKQLYFT